jgi:hypothetical protein
VDPNNAVHLLLATLWPPLDYVQVGSHPSRSDYIARSPWISIPSDPVLVDFTLVFQMVNGLDQRLPTPQVTNSLAVRLR